MSEIISSRTVEEFYRLHEKLTGDWSPALTNGPCKCGHERGRHAAKEEWRDRGACEVCELPEECINFRPTSELTPQGKRWLSNLARWETSRAQLEKSGLDYTTLVRKRFMHWLKKKGPT